MLSSFFSKSKPINFIIIGLYMLLFFILAYYKNDFSVDGVTISKFIIGFFVYVISMLLLNYITQKNDLTSKSTYTVLLFAFLTALLPEALVHFNIVLANLFVLLAVMSVLSFKNGKDIKAKVFNASIYVGLASLAYFWSIAFIFLIFLGVYFFDPKNYRNWIIPIIGLCMVFMFSNCFTLLFYDTFYSIQEYVSPVSLSFDNYVEKRELFSFGTLLICTIFFFFVYLIKYKRRSAKTKPIFNLVMAQLAIATTIALVTTDKNTAELYFIASPLAIIGTTYIEQEYGKLVNEINVWVFLLFPFVLQLF